MPQGISEAHAKVQGAPMGKGLSCENHAISVIDDSNLVIDEIKKAIV